VKLKGRLVVGSLLGLAFFAASIAHAPIAGGQGNGFKILPGPFVAVGNSLYWLDSSNVPQGWKLLPRGSLTLPPISPSEFAYYNGQVVITDAGEGWVNIAGNWTDVGPVPETAAEKSSWGQVKMKYLGK